MNLFNRLRHSLARLIYPELFERFQTATKAAIELGKQRRINIVVHQIPEGAGIEDIENGHANQKRTV